MPRLPDKTAIYEAADLFRERCLRTDSSLIWPDSTAWTLANIRALWDAFIGHPDQGKRGFFEKWRDQLAVQSEDVHRVAADVLAFYHLFPRETKAPTKLTQVRAVAGWQLPKSTGDFAPLERAYAERGIGRAGPHYRFGRPWQVAFYLKFAELLKARSIDCTDAAACKAAADDVEREIPHACSEARHAALHLLFPDQFEPIASINHKRKIVEHFADFTGGATDVDEALGNIHRALETRLGRTTPHFFYEPELRAQWDPGVVETDYGQDEEENLSFWVEKTHVRGRAHREEGEFALGKALWSPQQAKGGQDIYRSMREVEPGDVILHLTDNEGFTGVSRAATAAEDFAGIPDTEWGEGPSYLIRLEDYRRLDPPLLRETFASAPFRDRLTALLEAGMKNVFFERGGSLRQGAYLTRADAKLMDVLDDAYRSIAGQTLRQVVGATEGADTAAGEPALHLLLKWSADREPRAVDLHKRIADREGSVWWGKLGSRARAPLSRQNLRLLRAQLEAGTPTAIVLYRPGEVWRTRLDAITLDASEVDEKLLPTHYSKDECELFVRLSQFESVDPDWPLTYLVPARHPEPNRMGKALSSQSSLVLVQMQDVAPPPPVVRDLPTIDWLAHQTLWDRDRLEEITEALRTTRQVVLAGPPGTGKTFVAKHLATFVTQDRSMSVRTVQFHPSYGYEEFIEGLRPEVGQEGRLAFDVKKGVVREFVDQIGESETPAVLVIDEMNRANLPKVFGELMYLFEYREETIDLQYSSDFELPSNLLFIGTMNTADRSIRSIDIALRRRFDVFECPPDVEILKRFYEAGRQNDVADLFDGFVTLNEDLNASLDRHHTIGHTFFMADHMTPQRLRQVWQRKIGPLIEEYFFDQADIASEYVLTKYWKDV